jgi:hypothetical protein
MYKSIFLMLLILLLIFIITLLAFYNNYCKKYEHYNSLSGTFTLIQGSLNNILGEEDNAFYYDQGVSGTSHSGTINFNKKFSKNPTVFTQVNGSPDGEENIYSVNVSNVTPYSFNYYKNVIYNDTLPPSEKGETSADEGEASADEGEASAVVVKLSSDDNKVFNWFAF